MRGRRLLAGAALLVSAAMSACSGSLLRQYEYEEQIYLTVRGAATVMVDASIPALVALRGLKLDPSTTARIDQNDVRRAFEAQGCHVVSVGQPWRREGRRFVQVRLETDDVRTLAQCGVFAWSAYAFDQDDAGLHFQQKVGAAAGVNAGHVNWDGSELVAFKLHVPSKITFHNVRTLKDNLPGDVDRGNILTWEQTLADRRAGKPIDMDVKMESESILYRTIWLFGGAFGAAVLVLAAIVWLTMKRGKRVTL
ncbi:MAG TPA: hypothetical protein VJN96_00390 [Vicinamibacterales bacterium]|nr:hypothetical protein [Vicinamibacterales bacterium]